MLQSLSLINYHRILKKRKLELFSEELKYRSYCGEGRKCKEMFKYTIY